ncbi:MAG: tryptophan 2,3-dioxygenase family protein [Steroidobacteraceae bacterium]
MTIEVRSRVDNGVETFEATINGERIHWDRGLTYSRHIQTDQLLGAQIPVSPEPDEMLFIIMHQSMELWLKLVLHEGKIAHEQIRADRLPQAFKTLDRIATVMRHMIHSWEVLATLTPHDFLTFRGYLRKASGFQSWQYRILEFMLGNKNADLIIVHRDSPEHTAALNAALQNPSIYDVSLQLLARRGFAVPKELLERDWTQPYQPHAAVEKIWMDIYRDVEPNWDLYQLGERLAALEYYLQEWRFKHMKTVSRVIGDKRGTGGSSGVSYLVKALDQKMFPELWSMRTDMQAPVMGTPSGCPV